MSESKAARRLVMADQFARISEELLNEPGPEMTLERVVQLALETITPASACAISLRRDGQMLETPAATSSVVKDLDDLQYRLQEGPCWDAAWMLDTKVITDMRTESRWPRWAPAAADAGIGSVLSVRVATAEHIVGALNLYAQHTDAFDDIDVATASIFARHAASALAVADRDANLGSALLSRQAIGVAQGMVMQRYRLSLDQSFELLRRYSQDHNIKVRDLAERLVRAGGITRGLDDAVGIDS